MPAPAAITSLDDAGLLTRVRRAARAALTGAGHRNFRLTLLRRRRYYVFRVDASGRRRFVLRVRDEGSAISPAAATAQLRWLASISAQTQLVAPAPAGAADLLAVDVAGDRRWAALLTWVF